MIEKPYWIIDVLPKQVPASSPGRYFTIEKYLLSHLEDLCRKFAGVLLKLNCYRDLMVSMDGENWTGDFAPEDLERFLMNSIFFHLTLSVSVLPSDALITFSGDDHYMTLFGPDGELLDLIRELASAEGLFVWSPNPE